MENKEMNENVAARAEEAKAEEVNAKETKDEKTEEAAETADGG